MKEISVLIGGQAGFGIDKAGNVIAGLLSRLGYNIYIYRDYPSLIRGGHTFSVIRASENRVAAHRDAVDVLLALNRETVELHAGRLKEDGVMIYDAGAVDAASVPSVKNPAAIPITDIIKEEKAAEIMRNTCIIGALTKALSLDWDILDDVFRKNFSDELDKNLKVARKGFESSKIYKKLDKLSGRNLPIATGNETTALGLVRGGLDSYISYPMTPSSPILHYLAGLAQKFGLKIIHPESEIAVMLMALGMVYSGKKTAVGTSGGGFCLMTEGLSFSGMAELPVVTILGQRPGPSTGLPTYSCQTELRFALNAGQGEFTRFIIAPSDAEEAYYAAQLALDISWRYQIPSIILTDKAMAEGTYTFDIKRCVDIDEFSPVMWNGEGEYKRYEETAGGISPLAFPGRKGAVIKANSYEHDEYGISTEDPAVTVKMQDKRLRKEKLMAGYLDSHDCVNTHGNKESDTVLLCWGSNRGVCEEVAEELGIRTVQPLVLWPFPLRQFDAAIRGAKKIVAVENNTTGQLAGIVSCYGYKIADSILKYDGRSFSVEELKERVKAVLR